MSCRYSLKSSRLKIRGGGKEKKRESTHNQDGRKTINQPQTSNHHLLACLKQNKKEIGGKKKKPRQRANLELEAGGGESRISKLRRILFKEAGDESVRKTPRVEDNQGRRTVGRRIDPPTRKLINIGGREDGLQKFWEFTEEQIRTQST